MVRWYDRAQSGKGPQLAGFQHTHAHNRSYSETQPPSCGSQASSGPQILCFHHNSASCKCQGYAQYLQTFQKHE
jgi:hypothetical protein